MLVQGRQTANSKQVFDFLYQPVLLHAQLSGIDPMALQDLGSAKHQAELHTLALLILLHRLKTLDVDALEEYPRASFDPKQFLLANSGALTFRDIDLWDVPVLAADLHTLVSADKPGQLLALKPMVDPGQFGGRDEAHLAVLKIVLEAVFAVTSLGSPIVVENGNGVAFARTGYLLDRAVRRDRDTRKFAGAHRTDYRRDVPPEEVDRARGAGSRVLVIVAVGTSANPLIQSTTPDLKTNRKNYIEADPETLHTSKKGVFAGGDIVTDRATVILAMGAGRQAARAIGDTWPSRPGDGFRLQSQCGQALGGTIVACF